MTQSTLSREEIIARNLAVVEAHFAHENPVEVDKAVALYTDDIVWEIPTRDRLLRDKGQVAAEYRGIFASVADLERDLLDKFATEDRVVTDEVVRFRLTGDGFINAPYSVGTRVEMRLVHIFHMRGFKIAREQAYETWRQRR